MVEQVDRELGAEVRSVGRKEAVAPDQAACQPSGDQILPVARLKQPLKPLGDFRGGFRHGCFRRRW